MAKTRLEISIAYTDKKGQKRYVNNLGSLWLDTETMKGNIDLPPGVSISGGEHYVNVQLPRERTDGGGGGGTPRSRPQRGFDTDDEIPF